MQKTIFHQFYFEQGPEMVWKYLTDPDLLALWLMPNDFKLEVGHKFQFGTKPKYKLGFDGRIYCEVLEIKERKKLVYSWKGGMSKSSPSLDSIVTWTLIPKDEGCVLQLEHQGFIGFKNFIPFMIMNKGWMKIGKRLGTRMKTGNYE